DPDGIFESNLRRCGVELLVRGPAKIDKGEHAARQLARPMQELGLAVTDLAAKVYPSTEDRQRGQEFLRDLPRPLVVFHPGSGISQLAAAAGANCILLFGPTNPEIWAPKNEKVQVIQAPTGDMPSLRFETVRDALINRLKACLPGE